LGAGRQGREDISGHARLRILLRLAQASARSAILAPASLRSPRNVFPALPAGVSRGLSRIPNAHGSEKPHRPSL